MNSEENMMAISAETVGQDEEEWPVEDRFRLRSPEEIREIYETKIRKMESEKPAVYPVPMETVASLQKNTAQLGQYVGQLGMIIGAMQRRMEELEAKQAAVTVRHEDVKRLQARIRMRADEICGKYDLKDRESAKIFRAAIKKDLLKRFGVKDLHDVPAAMLGGAETMIGGWVNIRLAMERREAR